MDVMMRMAEQRIQAAMDRGDFDDLPGKGRPEPIDDDLQGVPEDLRVAYKILKNAGCAPPELEARKACLRLADLLRFCEDDRNRETYRRQLSAAQLRYELLMRRQGRRLPIDYADQVRERLS